MIQLQFGRRMIKKKMIMIIIKLTFIFEKNKTKQKQVTSNWELFFFYFSSSLECNLLLYCLHQLRLYYKASTLNFLPPSRSWIQCAHTWHRHGIRRTYPTFSSEISLKNARNGWETYRNQNRACMLVEFPKLWLYFYKFSHERREFPLWYTFIIPILWKEHWTIFLKFSF